MGLYQQAGIIHSRRASERPGQAKPGLLRRIETGQEAASPIEEARAAFEGFMATIGSERGGLLAARDDEAIRMVLSVGLDLTTTRRFCPAPSDLDALIDRDGWNDFRGEGLAPFLGFFSSHERESISALHITRLRAGRAIYAMSVESRLDASARPFDPLTADSALAALESALQRLFPVLSTLADASVANPSRSFIESHARGALSGDLVATLVSLSIDGVVPEGDDTPAARELHDAVVSQIARQAGPANVAFLREDGAIALVLFGAAPVDADLYLHQLRRSIARIAGEARARCIAASTRGVSRSLAEILDFVYKGI